MTHSDGAPAFTEQLPGSYHDKVVHGTSGGKRKPEYTKVVEHELTDGTKMKAQAGTQSLDGWWTHGKKACHGVKAQDDTRVEDHVRAEQWRHWVGAKDRWAAAGDVFAWAAAQ